MRIYDISKLECPLLAIHSIRGGSYEEDLGRSLALINTMPQTSSTSNVNPTRDSTKKTARGDRVPPKVEEILLVGLFCCKLSLLLVFFMLVVCCC